MMSDNTQDHATNIMKVLKRGTAGYEKVDLNKITARITNLCHDLSPLVDPVRVAVKTVQSIYDGIPTEELDRISAGIAEEFKLIHPDYGTLAARITISNLHKSTPASFSECMRMHKDMLSDEAFKFITENADELDAAIDHTRDYKLNYFGARVLESSYLMKKLHHASKGGKLLYKDYKGNVVTDVEFRGRGAVKNGVRVIPVMTGTVVDRPQYLFMRVAVGILMNRCTIAEIIECYDYMSNLYFTHATPTLFNACGRKAQLTSCFLFGAADSIEDIMKTLSDASLISKWAGGIAIWYHYVRATGSIINSTGGESTGPIPQLKMFDDASVCWNQGGRRKGSFAIYFSLIHIDAPEMLELKLNQDGDGDENTPSHRARNLFYAIWLEDYIQRRLELGQDISLFSPSEAPGLVDVYDGMDVCKHCRYCHNPNYAKYVREPTGDYENCVHEFVRENAFTELYERYEDDGLAGRVISAKEMEDRIAQAQRESGTPYICSKDQANRLSNQSNIDTIRSTNLCTEVYEVSTPDSYACCTLASISLPAFLVEKNGRFKIDHKKLHKVARMITRNLDMVIDVNDYPVKECVENSRTLRPIGQGIQGLADVFCKMRIPYISAAATKVRREINETIFDAFINETCDRAEIYGPHKHWETSPAARGKLHIDLWVETMGEQLVFSGRYDWNKNRARLMKVGPRNSLGIARMPTVSTSQILGNNESFEPFFGNIYVKSTIAGKFIVTNTHMIRHLLELGLWDENVGRTVMANDGSIQNIGGIPQEVKDIYKTVWEIRQSEYIDEIAKDQPWVDQGISMNIHTLSTRPETLQKIRSHAWKRGLKTLNYYINSRAATKTMQNIVVTPKSSPVPTDSAPTMVCRMEAGCVTCSS